MNSYKLSRNYFDWCFENPEKITPNHTAIYFFAVEHCNRLGWKEKFGLPSQMVMDAIGIKNWRTYIKAFNDLTEWGFFELIEKSKNQYSSNIIAIVKNTKATTKALDKAMQTHIQKQGQSIVSIDKPINNITTNNKDEQYRSFAHLSISINEFHKLEVEYYKKDIDEILDNIQNYALNKKYRSLYLTAKNWLKDIPKKGQEVKPHKTGDDILYENVMRQMELAKNYQP